MIRVASTAQDTPSSSFNWTFPLQRVASSQAIFKGSRNTSRFFLSQKDRLRYWSLSAGFGDSMVDKMKNLVGDAFNRQGDSGSYKFFEDNAPSWQELEAMLKEQKSSMGIVDPDPETGPPNPLSLRRTFGSTEPITVKLYRDHAAWCPYCQKVWMQLEEKRIPYELEKVNMRCYGDKKPSFLKLTPSGLLPVLEYKGRVITESATIAFILEQDFPDIPLLPDAGTVELQRAEALLRLERQCFSAWLRWLCGGWNEESHKRSFEGAMRTVDDELAVTPGSYFLDDFSLVDIVFAPFLERMDASLTYYKGFQMRKNGEYKNITRWFEAMETRPTYMATRSDYYTHAHALPPQLGGCSMTSEGKPFASRIDGDEWSLPLEPLSSQSFEPYSPGEDPSQDRYQAAKRIVENRAAVAKFACRGCGEEGSPVMAPLSNPNAKPNETAVPVVEAALRHVAHALLVSVETKQRSESGGFHATDTPEQGYLDGSSCYAALGYLRDRVGVPRDLKLPSARQLRAHLTWVMNTLSPA